MTTTYVAPLDTTQLLIRIGNGDGPPETFTRHALINTNRSVKITASATATTIPRTDDPTQPSKTVRTVVSTDSTITGEGTLDAADQLFWAQWAQSGAAKNVEAIDAISGGMSVSGPYVCTSFEKTGSKLGDKITASITLDQADDITIAATAAATAF